MCDPFGVKRTLNDGFGRADLKPGYPPGWRRGGNGKVEIPFRDGFTRHGTGMKTGTGDRHGINNLETA